MNQAILAIGSAGTAFLFRFIGKLLEGKEKTIKGKTFALKDVFFKGLSLLLFVLYMPHLFAMEEISNYIGLNNGLFSPAVTVLVVLLKWVTYLSTAILVMAPFFPNKKNSQDFTAFFVPLILLLNCIFFKQIVVSICGKADWYNWHIIIYSILIALMGGISGEKLIQYIKEKDFDGIVKRLLKAALLGIIYLMAFMPLYLPQLFFGLIGEKATSLVVNHRILIYICVLFPFIAHFIMRNKSMDERRYFLIMLALSGFLQYFSFNAHRSGLHSFPLHLCNTAIALMVFAYVFRIKSVFYFTYLVNVIGALCAIILPNAESEFTDIGTMVFWYNHTYAFVLPILGVSLKIFERPNIKLVGKAIAAFSVYVICAATLNAWLNNSPINVDKSEIDYFFLYSDFFVDKFSWAYPIKYNYVLKFQLGDTMMTYYYMYILTIFVIFIGLMFVMWGAYGILYKTGDSHTELARRKKLMRIDKLNLLKELDGRPLTAPISPEGVHMISIKNFSKTYAGSTKKAVNNISLDIHEGEVFGFIGHNGAGKSTTIKSLVGIQTITEGSIEICGYDIARQPLEAKLNIGYVSDNHACYEKLTGREYISYVADLYMVSEKDKNERIEKYAKMFNLTDALDREIKSYSHGMKQKTMVISALIHNPKVWVLDEPLTGLDPTSSYQIKECMRQHANEGNIVFFSSHVIEVVERICDRIAIISGGEICRVDRMEDIMKNGVSLEQIYLQYALKGKNADKENEDTENTNSGENDIQKEVASTVTE